jgi:hypothetical protein
MAGAFPTVLSGRMVSWEPNQTLRVWLLSGCAFGTKHNGQAGAKQMTRLGPKTHHKYFSSYETPCF